VCNASTKSLLVSSIAAYVTWNIRSVYELFQTYNVTQALFGVPTVPFLLAATVFYYAGLFIEVRGARHLGMAMFYYNRNVCGSLSVPRP